MNKNKNFYLAALVVGLILELVTLTFTKGSANMYLNPLLWILGGCLTIIGAMPFVAFSKANEFQTNDIVASNETIFKVLAFFIVFATLIPCVLTKNIAAHPSNPLESDVIPTIEILVRRVLHGEWVYAPIDFPGWTVNNAYLPMQYLPFVIAEKLHIDYRWLAYLSFVIVLIFWVKQAFFKNAFTYELVLKLLFIFLAILFINKHDWASFAFSLEFIDVAFYLFLALSFFIKDWKIKGLAILFCLLSRYAFVFWLPFYAITFWMENGKKEALRIIGFVVLGVVVLYVLPFLTTQPTLFFDGLKYYDKTAIGQWTEIPSWYQHVGKPFHLSQGLSTSIYFYDFWQGDLLSKLGAARKFHIIACLLSVAIISFCYWIWKKREDFNYQGFLLLSLKFYLIFFYGFFYVPFSYLYLIPFFYSVAILFKVSFSEKAA